jgi:hypothetical protein
VDGDYLGCSRAQPIMAGIDLAVHSCAARSVTYESSI